MKKIKELCTIFDVTLNQIAYIGDDLPDIYILKKVGFAGCPANAVKDVQKVCNYIIRCINFHIFRKSPSPFLYTQI